MLLWELWELLTPFTMIASPNEVPFVSSALWPSTLWLALLWLTSFWLLSNVVDIVVTIVAVEDVFDGAAVKLAVDLERIFKLLFWGLSYEFRWPTISSVYVYSLITSKFLANFYKNSWLFIVLPQEDKVNIKYHEFPFRGRFPFCFY